MFKNANEVKPEHLRDMEVYLDKAVDNLRMAMELGITDGNFNHTIHDILQKLGPYEQKVVEEFQRRKRLRTHETYYMVWEDEEQKWHYFKDNFDESQFPNGFTDYLIVVENGYIVFDTFRPSNAGLKITEAYKNKNAQWTNHEG
jgi:hypothetical protein